MDRDAGGAIKRERLDRSRRDPAAVRRFSVSGAPHGRGQKKLRTRKDPLEAAGRLKKEGLGVDAADARRVRRWALRALAEAARKPA
jgi:hypothetical protein